MFFSLLKFILTLRKGIGEIWRFPPTKTDDARKWPSHPIKTLTLLDWLVKKVASSKRLMISDAHNQTYDWVVTSAPSPHQITKFSVGCMAPTAQTSQQLWTMSFCSTRRDRLAVALDMSRFIMGFPWVITSPRQADHITKVVSWIWPSLNRKKRVLTKVPTFYQHQKPWQYPWYLWLVIWMARNESSQNVFFNKSSGNIMNLPTWIFPTIAEGVSMGRFTLL